MDWAYLDPRIHMKYVPTPEMANIPDADFVFITYWPLLGALLDYPKDKGLKGYYFQHYETWAGPKKAVDATWQASILKIAVSKWLMEIGRSLGSGDLYYVPDAVDHKIFKIVSPIESRPKKISMLYSRSKWKGSEDGIKALQRAKEAEPALSAVLFGVDDRPKDLPDWIEYHCNPTQAVLANKIYNKSSIFLCTSRIEGFALPPAEAMACGCAVVSTDCGGNRDFSIDRETALLSPPDDHLGLAGNILKLLKDNGLRLKLAKAGNQFILQFNYAKTVKAFEEALEDYHENMLNKSN